MVTVSLCALLFAAAVQARMYQWTDARSGAVQLSGEPPSWYRSGREGPRVLVFEGGFLVDDTSIEVSFIRRLALRNEAFEALEERRALADLERLKEGEERRSALAERDRAAESDSASASAPEEPVADAPAPSAGLPEVLDADGIARLKAIISAFDQLRQ